MTLFFVLALALQEPSVAQDPHPDAFPAAEVSAVPEPATRKKRKKQDQEELPGATRPQPEDLHKGKRKKADYEVEFRVGMTLEYNDNIIRLDDDDLRAFRDGSKPEKFRIRRPEDWIFSPWGEIDMALHVFDAQSRAGIRLTGHLYQANTFASNGALAAFLKGKPYSLEYTFEPNIYRREYRNLDTGVFESAFYDDHLLEAALKIPVQETIMIRPKAGVEIRDYDAPFTFRTSIAPFVAPRATLVLRDEFQPFVGYEFVWNQTFASGVQPDVSYYQNGVELGVGSRIVGPLELELRYRLDQRVYTTNNDASFDSHAGREDLRHRLVAGAAWKATAALTIEASFSYRVIDSSIPADADEDSDWQRRQYLLGLTYVF